MTKQHKLMREKSELPHMGMHDIVDQRRLAEMFQESPNHGACTSHQWHQPNERVHCNKTGSLMTESNEAPSK